MNLDVVIVTYNRLDKLKKTLSSYENQSYCFRNLIIVNNCSTDGTTEFLSKWEKESTYYGKYVLNLSENIGGSGGFYNGQKFAMTLNPDWIFLADDDAYPRHNAFSVFNRFIENNDTEKIAAICGTVYNNSGAIDIGHRKILVIDKQHIEIRPIPIDEYQKDYFDLDLFSYVGTFIKNSVLQQVGLCNPNLFIYYDDTEHSYRVKSCGNIICLPEVCIDHDAGDLKTNEKELLSWRNYYNYRNKIFFLQKINKRHALIFSLKLIFQIIIYFKLNIRCVNLVLSAVWDGNFNNLGVHKVYKPGFSIQKK